LIYLLFVCGVWPVECGRFVQSLLLDVFGVEGLFWNLTSF
jgi:hypothetical protein